jgi:copper chaperone NosL
VRGRSIAVCAALAACAAGPPAPAELDTRTEACRSCRMAVSEARFAAQLVARGGEPLFFDDIGCLRAFLRSGESAASRTAYIADHRTRQWVSAERAVYTRVPGLSTPMGSQLVAHADAASRDLDPSARGGSPVPVAEVLGAARAAAGGRP